MWRPSTRLPEELQRMLFLDAIVMWELAYSVAPRCQNSFSHLEKRRKDYNALSVDLFRDDRIAVEKDRSQPGGCRNANATVLCLKTREATQHRCTAPHFSRPDPRGLQLLGLAGSRDG